MDTYNSVVMAVGKEDGGSGRGIREINGDGKNNVKIIELCRL